MAVVEVIAVVLEAIVNEKRGRVWVAVDEPKARHARWTWGNGRTCHDPHDVAQRDAEIWIEEKEPLLLPPFFFFFSSLLP